MDFVGGGSFRIGEMGRGKAAWTLGWIENGVWNEWVADKTNEVSLRRAPHLGVSYASLLMGAEAMSIFFCFWTRGRPEDIDAAAPSSQKKKN